MSVADVKPVYLTAKEAAAELGVSLATLYAYVSRDMIRSEPVLGSRARRYRADDVRDVKGRRAARQAGPGEKAPQAPLAFGTPVLDSAITLIAEGGLFYRGSDATKLAGEASLEAVATLLWEAEDGEPFRPDNVPVLPKSYAAVQRACRRAHPIDRCMTLLPVAATEDPGLYNRTPKGLADTGARILRLLAGIMADADPGAEPLHAVLARAWTMGDARSARLIRAALVLAADHELNASAFTVRCVAATGAHLYACLQSGIGAAAGPKHGGVSGQVQTLMAGLSKPKLAEKAIQERLREGSPVPGFGHPLYPQGDPRAECLLALLAAEFDEHPTIASAEAVRRTMREATGLEPNIDFAFGTLAVALQLPKGASLCLFVLGRTAGWVAHAMEQYALPDLIRPRARYTGTAPRLSLG